MKIKLSLFTAFAAALLLSNILAAQTLNYLWARQGGGPMGDHGQGVCTDAAGNVLVAGWGDSNSMTFDTISFLSPQNIFIAKYDASGNVLWVRTGKGNSLDNAFSVTTDADMNVIVCGMFSSAKLVFGTDTLRKTVGAGNNAFIVKYDPAGNVLWAKSSAGGSVQSAMGVSTDAANNIYMTGNFDGYPATFGTTVLAPSSVGSTFFLVKYDPAGNVLWARKSSGTAFNVRGYGVSIDSHGNALVTGSIFGTGSSTSVSFDTVSISTTTVANFFITKYDSAGNALWARYAGGPCSVEGHAISTDGNDNVYVTGWYYNGASTSFGGTTLANAGGMDIFVLKYDASGNLTWAKSHGGTDEDRAYGISANASGNVVVTGLYMSPSITFGSSTFTYSGAPGMADLFIAQYDASGNVTWVNNPPGNSFDRGFAAHINDNGDIFITGDFNSATLAFGPHVLSCSSSDPEMFLVKLVSKSGSTGIAENTTGAGFSIYPNPANGVFTISAAEEFSGVDVINVIGEIVYSEKISGRQMRINLSEQANGIYFVRLRSAKGTAVQRVCITK